MLEQYKEVVEQAWENRELLSKPETQEVIRALMEIV